MVIRESETLADEVWPISEKNRRRCNRRNHSHHIKESAKYRVSNPTPPRKNEIFVFKCEIVLRSKSTFAASTFEIRERFHALAVIPPGFYAR